MRFIERPILRAVIFLCNAIAASADWIARKAAKRLIRLI